MAYRVGQVIQQPIPSYGEVMDKVEDQQLQQQDRQLRALTLQEAVEQRRARAAEAQAQAAETALKQDFLKQAFSTYRHDNGRPDLDAIADEFEKAYPEDGIKFRSAVNLDRQRAVQTKKMEFENHRDIGQISGRMLRTANPQNYAQIRQSIVQLDPDADKALPPQFDPAAVQQLIQQSDSLIGEFDDKAKAADSFDTKPLEWFGRNAKYIRSQADLDELYDDAALKMRAPELRELKRAYGDQYSPEWNANAQQVALSLEKAPKPTASGDFTLGPNQKRFDAQGKVIATGPSTPTGVGGGGVTSSDKRMVDAILKNPATWDELTPTIKSRLIVPLTEAGFDFSSRVKTDGKPSNGMEKRALNFFNRAKQASEELANIEEQIAGSGTVAQLWRENAPNFMQTTAGQQYTAAQRAFTEARLRKDSGAAIPPQEFDNDRRTYFVQAGDSPQVIEQKRRGRAAMLASLGFESGRALGEFYGDDAASIMNGYKEQAKQPVKAGAPAPTGAPARPAGVPPEAVWDAPTRSWVIR